jgi:disulfide bond formation protein DsbB
MFRRDYKVYLYALPLTIIGGLVAFYHVLLNAGVIEESLAPCRLGVSCTTKYFEFWGFMNIPFLSLVAFIVIGTCMVWLAKLDGKKSQTKKR